MTSPPDEAALVARAADELRQHERPIEVVLRPVSAFQLVGLLQLALRHPGTAAGPSALTARTFIEHVRAHFKLVGAPACVEMIARGDDPANDVPF